MAERHCGVGVFIFLAKHRSHGFANNVATPQHHDFGAGNFDVGADGQFADSRREPVEVRYVRQHVVGVEHVGVKVFRTQPARQVEREEQQRDAMGERAGAG